MSGSTRKGQRKVFHTAYSHARLTFRHSGLSSAFQVLYSYKENRSVRKASVLSAVLALALLPAASRAQQAAGQTIVLKAARLFDGKNNTLMTPGVVIVKDGKIVAVGSSLPLIPAGAEVINLGEATLLPGFIDAHTHVTMMNSDDWKQRELDRLQKPIAEQALDASVNTRITLMAGITTVRDVGSRDYLDVGLRNAIRNGKVPGPRMLVSVHAIGATG
jgi:imidazolonepropionase-like amidohydrolase